MKRAMLLVFTAACVVGVASCGGGGDDADAGVLQFAAANFTVNEDGVAIAAVTVRRIGGSDGSVSATIMFTDGTATGGAPPLAPPTDYDNTPRVVTFAGGNATDQVVAIPILDDTVVEANETVNLTLGTPAGGASVGVQTTAVLVISNNDSAGTFAFTSATASYNEDGTPVNVLTVRRTNGASGIAQVQIQFTAGTAAVLGQAANEPPDVGSSSVTVVFADLDTADKTVVGLVSQDARPEIDEDFTATISSAGAGSIGTQASSMVTIVDDDTSLTISPATPATNARFGAAIVGTATALFVGEPGFVSGATPNTGIVRLIDGNSGSALGTLATPIAGAQRFGFSLATRGPDLVVGAPLIGTPGGIFVFDAATLGFRFYLTPTGCGNPLGAGTVLATIPTLIATAGSAGCAGPGQLGGVFIYDPLTGSQVQAIIGTGPGEMLGESLVWLVGDRLAAGAPNTESIGTVFAAGAVRIFTAAGAELLRILNPFPAQDDRFGAAVATVGDLIAIGAPGDDTLGANAGLVYLFDSTTGVPVGTIAPPAPALANGRFGARLATVRGLFAIQQPGAGTSASGVVHIADTAGTLLQAIPNPNPTANAGFGETLSAFDDQLAIGAPGQTMGGFASAGQAFIIKVN